MLGRAEARARLPHSLSTPSVSFLPLAHSLPRREHPKTKLKSRHCQNPASEQNSHHSFIHSPIAFAYTFSKHPLLHFGQLRARSPLLRARRPLLQRAPSSSPWTTRVSPPLHRLSAL